MLADFGVGEVLWSLIWFFLFILWIMLVFRVFGDLFTDHKLSGWAKVAWSILVIIFPFFGVFIYLIVRGPSMAARDAKAMEAQEAATRQYIQQAAGTSASPADELAKLASLRDSGTIDEAEFQKLKAKVVGS
jgi:hypothetical protein